ncbi:hypothetical protein EG827_04180 [bacterium]|nr:hypothetical protein [bacterium]
MKGIRNQGKYLTIFTLKKHRMKKYFIILGSLQVFTAVGAIPAGTGYLLDITGGKMGVSPDLLAGSPLHSFLLPGLFLLLVNGLANVLGAYLSFTRHRFAGYAGLILGVALTLWIIIQVAWISLSSFLQPLFLVIGLINTFLSWKIIQSKVK